MKKTDFFAAKAVVSVLVSGIMLFSENTFSPVYALTEMHSEESPVYSEEINGVSYTLDSEGVFTCSGRGEVESRYVIGELKDKIKKVVIEEGLTYVGPVAFYGCDRLTEVTLSDSVTDIGLMAFYGCTGLSDIDISGGVTFIEEMAFENTAFYNSFEEGAVYIGNIFYKYKGELPENTRIKIKPGTTGISPAAFSGCTGLVGVDIPDSVKSIGSRAFEGCTGLSEVTVPDGVASVEIGAFRECTGLREITLPGSVTAIKPDAFSGCRALEVIYGCKGSCAEAYAAENGYRFIDTGSSEAVMGDTDGNGSVTASDAVLLAGFLLGRISEDHICRKSADMNENGKTDIADLVLLKAMLVGV